MVTKQDLFEDVALAMDSWTAAGTEATTNPAANLEWADDAGPYRVLQAAFAESKVDPGVVRRVLSECFRGFAVSIFTALDGGSASAVKGRLYLVDDSGRKVGEGLHAEFVGHLIDTGRL